MAEYTADEGGGDGPHTRNHHPQAARGPFVPGSGALMVFVSVFGLLDTRVNHLFGVKLNRSGRVNAGDRRPHRMEITVNWDYSGRTTR
jgi:hypothetical protein